MVPKNWPVVIKNVSAMKYERELRSLLDTGDCRHDSKGNFDLGFSFSIKHIIGTIGENNTICKSGFLLVVNFLILVTVLQLWKRILCF